ncbi:hypothetical protein FOVG_01443 [Fusarium oxysporum f. sp. pisi HDV247]|uniref:Uncharacterized protein n=1 Tax=Fusarium oxysporum f. sp. pisi HDV247 TaxID=1080344 RepID=W9QH75_FUSOX|nr:hypothetical protein FOVG_01443 [Fusarium oxysporum f. sp. pisi HDV247]
MNHRHWHIAPSGGKKHRVKFITAARQPGGDNIEFPPALKKRRITLKTRPWAPSEKKQKHAGSDAVVNLSRPWTKHLNKQAEIGKHTKTCIILKTGVHS